MSQEDTVRGNGYAVARDLTPRLAPVASLKSFGRETRKHPPSQMKKLKRSLREYGFVYPVLIDCDGKVVAGWALVQAAREMGLTEIPTVTITDLSEAQLRTLRLALIAWLKTPSGIQPNSGLSSRR